VALAVGRKGFGRRVLGAFLACGDGTRCDLVPAEEDQIVKRNAGVENQIEVRSSSEVSSEGIFGMAWSRLVTLVCMSPLGEKSSEGL
jgi:hypothetical protein